MPAARRRPSPIAAAAAAEAAGAHDHRAPGRPDQPDLGAVHLQRLAAGRRASNASSTAASFTACPAAGKSYAGPLAQGTHTFKVRASRRQQDQRRRDLLVDGRHDAAERVRSRSPLDGARSARPPGGTAAPGAPGSAAAPRTPHGVAAVCVSIRRGGGNWWGGSAFDQTSETFQAATLTAGRTAPRWSYPLALPADGTYTVHVRAHRRAPATRPPRRSQAALRFTIDTTPPPAPAITSRPGRARRRRRARPSPSPTASPGVSFLCRRDERALQGAARARSPTRATRAARTRFHVQARDAAGNISAADHLLVDASSRPIEGGKPFTVAGNAAGPLAPGVSRPLALTRHEPEQRRDHRHGAERHGRRRRAAKPAVTGRRTCS